MDEERVRKLVGALLLPIRANYVHGPLHPDRVLEALNALAIAAAVTTAGADEEALKFFLDAFTGQLNSTMAAKAQEATGRN